MVVSVVTENWASINSDADEFEKFEIPEIDSALLMSLLEESQADQDCDDDDERLMTVIRSLEAEIDPNVMDATWREVDRRDKWRPRIGPPQKVINLLSIGWRMWRWALLHQVMTWPFGTWRSPMELKWMVCLKLVV
ncbi:hypothetical protein CsSME_00026673 [Camellia sinensis var. sinensis]